MHEAGTKEYAEGTLAHMRAEHPDYRHELRCDDGWWWVDCFLPNRD